MGYHSGTPDNADLATQQADGQTDLVTPAARVAAEALAPKSDALIALANTEPAALEGIALTNASATIQPFTDAVSQYQDKAVLTDNRTTTLGVTSATGMLLRIVRAAGLAYNRTIAGSDGYTKYVFPANAPKAIEATFQHNGAYWIFLGWRYVRGL